MFHCRKGLALLAIFCGGFLIITAVDRATITSTSSQLLEQPSAEIFQHSTPAQVMPKNEYKSVPELPSCKSRKQKMNNVEKNDMINDNVGDPPVPVPLQLPIRQSNASGGRKFLVATLDGKVTLLDQSGRELWYIQTGKLFSSTISSLQLSENGKWVNLIPSLTGGLYKYDEESLLPMPMNVDSLLQKSFKLSNDVVITGGKELRTFGIDLNTGRVRYDCGISGCLSPQMAELEEETSIDTEQVTLIVKKQLQTVRAIDSQSGNEKWNFSVGTHELGLAGLNQECYEEEQKESGILDYVKVIIPEGRLLSANPESHTVWDKKFETPIAQAWVLENGRLVYVDPIQNTPLKEGSLALYVGKHNHQFYVQESQAVSSRLERLLEGYFPRRGISNVQPLKISWRPSFAAVTDESDSDSVTAITSLSTARPILQPFYVLNKDEIVSDESDEFVDATTSTPLSPIGTDADENNINDIDIDDPEEEVGLIGGMINEVFIGSLWYWWKEVLGISILTAVILNILLMKPLMRYVRIQTIRDTVRFVQEWATRNNIQNNDDERLPMLPPALNESMGSTSIRDNSATMVRTRTISESIGVQYPHNPQSPYEEFPEQEVEVFYMSQYLREFEPIECLGKGGFGVVFEAKKKIDDRHYAVKRIDLPNREEARIRVMREVKALAQLDHRNIVRYFNAWIENPPNGWLEKNDPLWGRSCLTCSLNPTVENISSQISSSHMIKSYQTLSTPSDGQSQQVLSNDNDSFDIVFDENASIKSFRTESATKFHKTKLSTTIELSSGDSSTGGNGFWKKSIISAASNSISWDKSLEHDNSQHRITSRVVYESEVCKLEKLKEDTGVELAEEAQETENSSIMYLYIQQELCQKRTLRDWLRTEKQRDLITVINFFGQIVDAVEYVHSKKLIHRDLKPSNIFLAGCSGESNDVLKIGDFGLATTALSDVQGNPLSSTTENKNNRLETNNLTSQVGTQLYMSPEQAHKRPYDYKVDIYSLGLIFFELMVAFHTEMERHTVISELRKRHIPSDFQDKYPSESSLIKTMISHNPHDRPDATSISQWVKGHLRMVDQQTVIKDVATTQRSNSSPGHIAATPPGNDNSREKRRSADRYKFQRAKSATTM